MAGRESSVGLRQFEAVEHGDRLRALPAGHDCALSRADGRVGCQWRAEDSHNASTLPKDGLDVKFPKVAANIPANRPRAPAANPNTPTACAGRPRDQSTSTPFDIRVKSWCKFVSQCGSNLVAVGGEPLRGGVQASRRAGTQPRSGSPLVAARCVGLASGHQAVNFGGRPHLQRRVGSAGVV